MVLGVESCGSGDGIWVGLVAVVGGGSGMRGGEDAAGGGECRSEWVVLTEGGRVTGVAEWRGRSGEGCGASMRGLWGGIEGWLDGCEGELGGEVGG